MIKILVKKLNFWQKVFGYLKEEEGKNLFFQTRFGVHTFYLKKSIDVLVLDKHFEVVKIKYNMSPNKVFFWNPKYRNILEMPSGNAKKIGIKLGMKIICYNKENDS